MGGLSFEKTYTLYVDFDNPGGLQSGAPVRVAGVKVGKVDELAFMGGKVDPKTNRRTLVRAKINVEARVKESIHDDADFYVTTQGVLGEQFLAIDPGSPQKGVLPEGSIVKGIDPPRLDLFLAKAYELLDTTMNGIRNNRELISDIATNTAGLLKGLNTTLTDNRERINRTMANLESLTAEANTLTVHARTQYVDNPKIARTIDNIDRLSTDIQKDSGPLLKDARESLANLNRASKVDRRRRGAGEAQEDDRGRRPARRPRQRHRRRRAGHRPAHQEGQRHRRRPRHGRGDLRRRPGDGARPQAQPVEVSLARVSSRRRAAERRSAVGAESTGGHARVGHARVGHARVLIVRAVASGLASRGPSPPASAAPPSGGGRPVDLRQVVRAHRAPPRCGTQTSPAAQSVAAKHSSPGPGQRRAARRRRRRREPSGERADHHAASARRPRRGRARESRSAGAATGARCFTREILRDRQEHVAFVDGLALGAADLLDLSGCRRLDGHLHLHRLEDHAASGPR